MSQPNSWLCLSPVDCELWEDSPREIRVKEGEALEWPCPNLDCSDNAHESEIFWYKRGRDGQDMEEIGKNESDRIHYHGARLYFLPIDLNDTGRYYTLWFYNGNECAKFETDLEVYMEFHDDLLYRLVASQASKPAIVCPFNEKNGSLTWYKDFHLIPGETEDILRIPNASKQDEGIYTCMLTWEHGGRIYNSSRSRRLRIMGPRASHAQPSNRLPPRIQYPVNGSTDVAELGSGKTLTCLAFFGINVRERHSVTWEFKPHRSKRYSIINREENGLFKSILTIHNVSETDFKTVFQCIARDDSSWVFVSVTLKAKESVLPTVWACVIGLLVFLLTLLLVKCFAVDLALFFRRFMVPKTRDDGKVYDAYVIYKSHNSEKTEKSVAHFISDILPTVMEDKCGFKLYIHGRDDLPGQDRMELVEKCIQLSRRLIVILTPRSDEGEKVTIPECYDWQVGLHQALVQGEMNVILIQVGDVDDFTHLPLSLQHLLQKSAPLRWKERSHGAASPNSRFWKRVRYMMPVPPCQSRAQTLKMLKVKHHGPQEVKESV
ncbi:interleukin-1 receptor-like 1 [Chanos chanos]|uniref:Interleukin-1 receptor-like 1 n=1 Tax=Chanos chanos TaxID=29144 RepID=A0A6J2WDY3_CHACN|nr:interleukin-1 receptor-like 1 [Chanos chanos]